jgi:hypothetical protein
MPTPVTTLTALQLVTPILPNNVQTISVDSSVLPIVVTADANTTRIEVSIYNTTYAVTTFTSATVNGVTQNTFSVSVPLTPSVLETTVQILARNYNPFGVWTPLTAFPTGYTFVDPNGNVQVATVGGVSGSYGQTGSPPTIPVQPTWNTAVDGITFDGSGSTIITWTCLGVLAVSPTIKFSLIFFQSNLAVQIGPPSAIQAFKNQTDCTLQWATPSYPGFIGVRVMLSTDPAGISPPYTQFGDLITDVSSSVNTVIDSEVTTATGTADPNTGQVTTVTTTSSTTMPTNYSTVDVPSSYFGATTEFYAMFSTVIQETQPNSTTVYESQQNGPLTCGYVNLKVVSPTDFPVLQRQQDIAGRLIGQIMRQQPNLDLSPRSEIRDTIVDPVAYELSNMSIREWFARCSTSISAISQIDNASGNGVSDPFNSSPFKQQIARAYGLNATNTQSLIDTQFNILGEQAGLTRGGATSSTVLLTFFTYTQPTQSITIPENATVATIADASTPALNFITRGSAVLDVNNLASFYNAVQGWWAVTVPAECATTGSVGNVGAGTIRSIVSGLPAGINVTNLTSAAYGSDQQSNAQFAALIQARLVTGVDTGTRHGYLVTALQTPGIIACVIVAAGDLDMLRDWDPIRQKHVYGCVDIYVEGTTLSQQNESVTFTYGTVGTYGQLSTYLPLTLSDPNLIRFNIPTFSTLAFPIYTAVELAVTRGSSTFYLGIERAQIDNVGGNIFINPNDLCYQYVGSGATTAKIPQLINSIPATNRVAVAAIAGASGSYTFGLFARLQSSLLHTPALQPVIDVDSVVGETGETGTVGSSLIELIHTSDFLLYGGSNNAGDEVYVATTTSAPVTKTITASTATPAIIDIAMDVPLSATGVPQNILSVLSTDLSTSYVWGVDYTIVPLDTYHTYGLNLLTSSTPITQIEIVNGVLTVTTPNNFGIGAQVTLSQLGVATFLSGAILTIATASSSQFTAFYNPVLNYAAATDSGFVTGSAIQNFEQVVVTYNQFTVYERPSFITGEQQILTGVIPTPLNNAFSFVDNIWLPESYAPGVPVYPPDQYHTLTLDGWDGLYNTTDGGLDVTGSAAASAVIVDGVTLGYTTLVGAQVPYLNRYIKVTYNNGSANLVMRENIDFTLNQNSATQAWQITRIGTGGIPDGQTVTISYFATETFTVSTEYPAFVQILANEIAITKSAAADVLIKAMVASPVDITMTVTLAANASPDVVDSPIRTAISIVLDNAEGTLYQSELISQVQAVVGVTSVNLPLLRCAKADGSYDIGVVIPTNTVWIPLAQDPDFSGVGVPANSFISASSVLPDSTIPSGGQANAVVDLLYQGQLFRRATSVADFLANSPAATHLASTAVPGSFYIFGENDNVNGNATSAYDGRIAIVVPLDVTNPGLYSYFVTYQVYDETGASDITVSSTEYLTAGNIVINYVTPTSTTGV